MLPIVPGTQESRDLARHILQRLGEAGQPPEYGVRRINVGNDSYLRILQDEYFGSLLRIGASFKLVQGYFGAGKTHFLYCIREIAWDHGFATALVELSPTECPYDDSLKVYRAVSRRLALRPARVMVAPNYGIADVLRNHVDDMVEKASASLGGDAAAARSEVDGWLQKTVARAACESHSYRQAVVGFCRAYVADDSRTESRLEAWLTGEPVPLGEVRDAGVFEALDRANGFTMLRCLTQMMVALGLPGTALLFDEVDRNLSVSAKRSQAIGDNLRQVIDLCGRHQLPNTLFVYAVPPEFMRTVVPDYPALYQRLKSPVALSIRSPQSVLIDLERLDLEPLELLCQLAERILLVFEEARGVGFNRKLQALNARSLAAAAVAAFFEVNHRRLFVKTWVDFLNGQLHDGEGALPPEAAADLVLSGNEALRGASGPGDFQDF